MDTIVDKRVVHGRVLPDEDLDCLLRGDSSKEGADFVELGISESNHLLNVLIFKVERPIVHWGYLRHNRIDLSTEGREVILALSSPRVSSFALVTELLHCANHHEPFHGTIFIVELICNIVKAG